MEEGPSRLRRKKGIAWKHQSLDGSITKAPLGGELTGPSPVDRAKTGTKRSLLTDGNGIPIALVVAGANRHDSKLAEPTLRAIEAKRPSPRTVEQKLHADKGYDSGKFRAFVARRGYVARIPRRGEKPKLRLPKWLRRKARRWVVERAHSWMNRFRRILIRWEKRADNYLAMLHLACAWIAFSQAGVLG